jgi:phage terminase Nu1 subunit (DNA packaging protein)
MFFLIYFEKAIDKLYPLFYDESIPIQNRGKEMQITLTQSDLDDLQEYCAAYDAMQAADFTSLSPAETEAIFSRFNHACAELAAAVAVAVELKEAC